MERVKPQRRRGYTRLSSKRQVTIPLHLLRETGLTAGDELKVEVDDVGRIVLSSVGVERRRAIEETAGALPGVYSKGELERLRREWR